MSAFAQWNDRLREHFFCEANAARNVRLAVNRDLLDDEFEDLGGSEGFEQAVQRGPAWPTGFDEKRHAFYPQTGLRDRALGMHRAWDGFHRPPEYDYLAGCQTWQRVPPPYLPYLCLFCYAWTLDEEDRDGDYLQGNNYFDRLELCYPSHELSSLNWTGPLWQGVQRWANDPRRMDRSLGTFNPEPLEQNPRWVNIAKAQVLFTAARVRRLPGLFDHLGLVPGHPYSEAALRDRIQQHPAAALLGLGETLQRIASQPEHPLHQEVLQELLEHLCEWPGPTFEPMAADAAGGQGPRQRPEAHKTGLMLLMLSPDEENARWQTHVTLDSESIPPGTVEVERDNRTWTCRLGSAARSRFSRRADGQTVYLSGEAIAVPDHPWTASARWTDKEVGTLPVTLRHVRDRIRFLQWDGPFLVERLGRPAAGVVYCLVHDQLAVAWKAWRARLPAGLIEPVCVPGGRCLGLPAGWTLWYICATERVPDAHWDTFPEQAGRPGVARILHLRGGSLLRSAARRTYLPFDLPQVVLNAQDDVHPGVTGGTVELVPADTLSGWATSLPATPLRTYRLQPEANARLIRLDAIRGHTRLDRVQVRLSREPGAIRPVDATQYRTDCFGAPAFDGAAGADIPASAGASGPWVPPVQRGWYNPTDGEGERALELLDWLANLGRRTPYSRVRDYLAARDERTNPAYQVKALAQLAHLELETDARGRWAYVHPLPSCLYALPTLRDGQYQAVLTGVYTREQRDTLRRVAAQHGIPLLATEQLGGGDHSRLGFVPRQRLLLARGLQVFQDIARDAGLRWHSDPPALRLAAWAGGLDDWERQLAWRRDPGFRGAHAYDPRQFRTMPSTAGGDGLSHSPQRVTDRLTDRHFLYQLSRREGRELRYASVAQKPWGCWLVQREAWRQHLRQPNPAALVPIPYDPEDGSLVFPLELEPPPILARALALCSGYAPSYISDVSAFASAESRFVLDRPYTGVCVVYEFIPLVVAQNVLVRLSAEPVALGPGTAGGPGRTSSRFSRAVS
jgi:hypothetical protein